MKTNYQTDRLSLSEINLNDALFILELVNTPEWIQFIGERNVKSEAEAIAYIQGIIENPNYTFWVVRILETKVPIGIISLIKRDYLKHFDIGFAFLPAFTKNGYAYEATLEVLKSAINESTHPQILATTIKENVNSIRLLEKLGLKFENTIEQNQETLLVYAITK
jgi:[ribosomal protein S5]-alanine N-acetyltransferase